MLKLVDASHLQTVVFVDLKRDLVSMYSINDASSRWNTYGLGLSDVRVIVAVSASFGRRRVSAFLLSSDWLVYYNQHRAQIHILTFVHSRVP